MTSLNKHTKKVDNPLFNGYYECDKLLNNKIGDIIGRFYLLSARNYSEKTVINNITELKKIYNKNYITNADVYVLINIFYDLCKREEFRDMLQNV